MELGIKGHPTRGDEIIKMLEMLGGKNRYEMRGSIYDNYFYYIDDEYKDISYSYIDPDEIEGYKIFSLEDFLEKFPYKVGDKVKVWKNYDYFGGSRAELEVAEIKSMRWNSARCEVAYRMKDQTGEFYKEDIKGKVKDDVRYVNSITDDIMINQITNKVSVIKFKPDVCDNQIELQLDDYEIEVRDGKTYAVKKKPTYPKTYEECCEVLSIPSYYKLKYSTYEHNYHEYTTSKKLCLLQDNLNRLGKLLICRDAYWKIAGEELGLNKPWEPDFSDDSPKYNIFKYENAITLSDNNWSNRILVFPTIEMRDAFYENFKELIEECKELL